MQNNPLVLMSCTNCSRLHEPQFVDSTNPVCAHCAAASAPPRPVLPGTPSPFDR